MCLFICKTKEQIEREDAAKIAWEINKDETAYRQLENQYVDKDMTPWWVLYELELAFNLGFKAAWERRVNDK